jgi:Alpha/beta hydrolase domain
MPLATEVLGPVVAERPPWGIPRHDVSELGYVVEEYFLEGVASAYRSPGPSIPRDGRWEAVEYGQAPYRTRILVVRPADPARFNGTVLLHWQNVSAGVEGIAPSSGETYEGYAWVGVSAQEVGLYGFPAGMRDSGSHGSARPLVDHDPDRYGGLHHPGDQGSFDIFAAAAAAVGTGRSGAVDPLVGLDVRRVIATGASQSAMRLATYLNAVHRSAPLIDGFVLALWEGRGPRLEEGPVSFGARTSIRDDLEAPVLVVNSEFETLAVRDADAADSALVRIWEIAGTPHAPRRDGEPGEPGVWGPNPLSIQPVFDAAVRQMQRWVAGGVGAPAQPRIEVEAGSRARIRRDERGNAIGGIRLPELAAPVAEYRGMSFGTGLPPLFGAARRFADEDLRAMYPSRADYVRRWSAAVEALVAAGSLRPEDAPAMVARGETVRLPVA